MLQVGIIGGAGYTAGELVRLLVNHPAAEINFVYSTSNAGNKIYAVHQDLLGATDLSFTDTINPDVDVVFLCLGHGNSTAFLNANDFSDKTKIIDLSNDFRLKADNVINGKKFAYGLPELNKEEIEKADNIANPGCFATAIQLGILPLAAANKINNDIHVNATTGSTGAGVSPSATTHFSWRDNNFSTYKVFTHQHLGEIGESIDQLQSSFDKDVLFIPNRGNFSRGIYASIYTDFDGSLEEAYEIYEQYYKDAAFTHVSKSPVHLKQVVNTNNCFIHLHKHNNKLLITSVIDNLLKGASGQAIQNMNLIFGFEENLGIQLKSTYF